jgi:hypothetical protein
MNYKYLYSERAPNISISSRWDRVLFHDNHLNPLQKGYKPRQHHNLGSLRHIYSTGSPLSAALFDFVYESIHPDVLLASITGELGCPYFPSTIVNLIRWN